MTQAIGPDYWGSGHCPMCGWSYDLHPYDAEGIDVGRCPSKNEQAILQRAIDRHKVGLKGIVVDFPRALPKSPKSPP